MRSNFHLAIPTPDRLLELIELMSGQQVAMLVDLVADRFITGTPKRISREAPVLILRFDHEVLIPGGGANAVANIKALAGEPLPLGVVGDDAAGHALLQDFAERGISTAGILVKSDYRTPTKTRILGGGRHSIKQQIVRYDIEDQVRLSDEDRRRLLAVLKDRTGVAVAVLSDYGYGAVVPELVAPIRQALGQEVVVLADSRYRLHDFTGLDGATPNVEEATAFLGHSLEDDQETLERGGQEILSTLQSRFVLVTRGSAGMSLFTRGSVCHLPVHGGDQVADVTGAGDTVIGTFALALAAGGNPLEAACLANFAGGIVVMKMGTATLNREELRAAVNDGAELLRTIGKSAES